MLLNKKDKEQFKKDYINLSIEELMNKWKAPEYDVRETIKLLRCKKSDKLWSDKNVEFLKRNINLMDLDSLAEYFSICRACVTKKIRELGLKKKRVRSKRTN